MDYLDPQKERRHEYTLLTGYICVAIAIVIATLILLYQAYGFGLGKNGNVIQNSLAFFSSQPHPANIYIDNKLYKTQTDSRVVMPEGIYQIKLSRDGYRDWRRTVELDGGKVQHYDYPLLFPATLSTKPLKAYGAAPGLVTQSPDRRWLMIEMPGSLGSFEVYDLKTPTKAPVTVSLPDGTLTKATTAGENLQLEEWASDNQHLVLQHDYDGKTEYILASRSPDDTPRNLNTVLSTNPSKLTLLDKKYDQYYLYDTASAKLQTASLDTPASKVVLEHVLAYQSYGSKTILYVTDVGAEKGKVVVKLTDVGGKTYSLRSLAGGTNYLLDLTKYSNSLYVAAGATSENKVYIYKDPIGQLTDEQSPGLAPAQVLHVSGPNYLKFSDSAQFVMVENGQQFGVYDAENAKGFSYTTSQPLDTPQAHASWMDGNRLTYISRGKLLVFDYDYTNQQSLMAASPAYLPVYASNYHYVYGMLSTPTGEVQLTQTALLVPSDL